MFSVGTQIDLMNKVLGSFIAAVAILTVVLEVIS